MKGHNSMLIFLMLLLLFLLWIAYEKRKSDVHIKKNTDTFWEHEQNANKVRRKDISALDYINIPFDRLPFCETEDTDLRNVQIQVQSLSGKKIINLSQYTNTDLKLMYGTANLEELSSYDHNYYVLIRSLSSWAHILYSLGRKEDALIVLEYALECNTDIRASYILLAKLYLEHNESSKIDVLIERAKAWNSLTAPALIGTLVELRNQCNPFATHEEDKPES